jgi:hypothetical protein
MITQAMKIRVESIDRMRPLNENTTRSCIEMEVTVDKLHVQLILAEMLLMYGDKEILKMIAATR